MSRYIVQENQHGEYSVLDTKHGAKMTLKSKDLSFHKETADRWNGEESDVWKPLNIAEDRKEDARRELQEAAREVQHD